MIPSKEHSFFFDNVSLAPSNQIGLHRQPSWELSHVLFGSGTRFIGDTTEPFQCGEVVMIPPEIPHCWRFNNDDIDSNGRISNITITFTDEFLNSCLSVFPELRKYIRRLMEIRDAVKFERRKADLIISILRTMCEQDDVERLASMVKLLAILSSTEDVHVVGTYRKMTKEQERLKMIHTFVTCNVTRDISLNEIVRYVGMNKSAFCVFLKRTLGKTFTTYLNEHRVELACLLLKQGNMSVSEIGYNVGFTNIPYFNRIFKKIKGCSPTKYSHD